MPGKPKTEAADYERATIRFPPKLLRVLQKQAKAEQRPFNTHVLRCLEQFLAEQKEKKREFVGTRDN